MSSRIKKGVLHLDQKEFGGGKDRNKGERKERIKDKEVHFSTCIPSLNYESSKVKMRARLRSTR